MKIAVGLSGGVDSSVAALLLKEQGYDIFGLFMQNWNDASVILQGSCTWEDDFDIARMVAKKLDIPLHFVDMSLTYKQRVVDYMFAEYARGRTPNPDVVCNREIKFDAFLDKALALGATHVATGHYCRLTRIHDEYALLAGSDPNKDQSYFLCQLKQFQLSKALFPIGHLLKPKVRALAAEAGLPTAERKDSQGICFVGKVNLPVFLQQQLKAKTGDVIEISADNPLYSRPVDSGDPDRLSRPFVYTPSMGKVIGRHQGAHYYTIGQRKGLDIGGHSRPLFIIATDTVNNIIYVGEGQDHPGLYRKALFIPACDVHWLRPSNRMEAGENRDYQVRIRYRQPLQQARVLCRENGIYIIFALPQRGITPGQFAVWYHNGELQGSGVIA